MKSRSFLVAAAGMAVLSNGCDQAGTEPQPALSAAEVQVLAPQYDALANSIVDGVSAPIGRAALGLGGTGGRQGDFSRTRECPGGGDVTISGTTNREVNREARIATVETTATKTFAACGFRTRGPATLMLHGEVQIQATRTVTPTGMTGYTTHSGSFDWTRGEESGTCAVELRSSFDSAAGTRRVEGQLCGREIHRIRTRT